jgi:hypothetical protein
MAESGRHVEVLTRFHMVRQENPIAWHRWTMRAGHELVYCHLNGSNRTGDGGALTEKRTMSDVSEAHGQTDIFTGCGSGPADLHGEIGWQHWRGQREKLVVDMAHRKDASGGVAMPSLGKDGKRVYERTVVRKGASGSVVMTALRRGGNGSEITISLRRGGSGAVDIELNGRKANQPTEVWPHRSANSRQSNAGSVALGEIADQLLRLGHGALRRP